MTIAGLAGLTSIRRFFLPSLGGAGGRLLLLPLPILRIVAWEVLDFALSFEHQQVVHHLVHEVAVVADHDDAAREVLQVFFQNLQRHNVKVIGGLVEHQEVGVLHQYRTQVQFSALTTAEFIYIIILLLGSKQEILQQLRGRHLTSTAQVHIVGDGSYHIDDLILLIKLQALLREVAELHRLEAVEMPKASAAIAEARDKGDLSENSEYDAAKEAQANLAIRINALKTQIADAKIVDKSRLSTDAVQLLSKVEMTNLANKAKMSYTIVSANEANLRQGKISIETPIAQALLNHKVGDEVEVKVPNGILKLKIENISY